MVIISDTDDSVRENKVEAKNSRDRHALKYVKQITWKLDTEYIQR